MRSSKTLSRMDLEKWQFKWLQFESRMMSGAEKNGSAPFGPRCSKSVIIHNAGIHLNGGQVYCKIRLC
uniref:Proline iminopeptidase n=1 Tax=Rhizophora mucronata TaxID=61149 RepID=A0A2P2KIQ3_RHIMU